MKTSAKDQQRTEKLLQRNRIGLHSIESFSFMKRYHQTPRKSNLVVKDKYGAGILTLHLKQGIDKAFYLHPFQHPASIVRYLLSQEIPFDNYKPGERTTKEIPTETYQRPSLYMFYFFVLFITFSILGYNAIAFDTWWSILLGLVAFGGSIYFIYMLMTRFCYLKTDNEALTIYSIGREIKYPYESLLKVNFDFARERAFTHVMELLDKDFHYHLFYIGRVSRRTLKEIAERLRETGIDATCSLDDDKRFYQDMYKKQLS